MAAAIAASESLAADQVLLLLGALLRSDDARTALREVRNNPGTVWAAQGWARWEVKFVAEAIDRVLIRDWQAAPSAGQDVAALLATAADAVAGLGRKAKPAQVWAAFDPVVTVVDPAIDAWLVEVVSGDAQAPARKHALLALSQRHAPGADILQQAVGACLERGGAHAADALAMLGASATDAHAPAIVDWIGAVVKDVTPTSEDRAVKRATGSLQRIRAALMPATRERLLAIATSPTHLSLRQVALDLCAGPGATSVVPALATMLNEDPQPIMRRAAARALAATRTPEAVAVLAAALDSDSGVVRRSALSALALERSPVAIERLHQLLQDESLPPEERQVALQFAGATRDPDLTDILIQIATTGSDTDRQAAIVGLLNQPTPAVRTVLAELATTSDSAAVRGWARARLFPHTRMTLLHVYQPCWRCSRASRMATM